ncbi:MAG: glycosyltransferase [Thermoplasmata archaeon]|nr:glycosyltransferase [Thermoplasmata archaeon]
MPASPRPGGPPAPAGIPGRVTVIVTVLRDPRVERTIASLLDQDRPPDEILVDDGGNDDVVRTIAERFHARDARVVHLAAPGTITESRNAALAVATGEFVAFLDADEVAPPGWLAALLRPFSEPSVGFTGGPTPGLPGSVRSVGARYYDGLLRRLYDRIAPGHPQSLPMGNSGWRLRLFRELGPLDVTLDPRAASEDQEFAFRALSAGWKGVYTPDAWVHHDFSDLDLRRLLRKQRIYARGGFVVWRRVGSSYEASGLRLAPYVLLPVLIVAGLLLLLIPGAAWLGTATTLAGVIGLGALAAGLSIWGRSLDARYPGLRYAVLEIPRRWATLVGALQGLFAYGWSGERRPRRGVATPPAAPPPSSP